MCTMLIAPYLEKVSALWWNEIECKMAILLMPLWSHHLCVNDIIGVWCISNWILVALM